MPEAPAPSSEGVGEELEIRTKFGLVTQRYRIAEETLVCSGRRFLHKWESEIAIDNVPLNVASGNVWNRMAMFWASTCGLLALTVALLPGDLGTRMELAGTFLALGLPGAVWLWLSWGRWIKFENQLLYLQFSVDGNLEQIRAFMDKVHARKLELIGRRIVHIPHYVQVFPVLNWYVENRVIRQAELEEFQHRYRVLASIQDMENQINEDP